jgi:hypothetical protein
MSFYYGGDSGHGTYVDYLRNQQQTLERIMSALDKRAYEVRTGHRGWLASLGPDRLAQLQLILGNQNASWLLKTPTAQPMCCEEEEAASSPPPTPPLIPSRDSAKPEEEEICLPPPDQSSASDVTLPESSASSELGQESSSATTISEDELPDTLDSLSLADEGTPQPIDSRAKLLSKLLAYCEDCGSTSSRSDGSPRRVNVVANLFRFAVSRTPCLLVRAQPFQDVGVKPFLIEGDLATEDLDSLWERLKFSRQDGVGLLGPEVIRNAIVDLTREPTEEDISEGRCFKVLGGWVWKEPDEREMEREEWDDLYDFVSSRLVSRAAVDGRD